MKLDTETFYQIKLAAMLQENTQLQMELAHTQENLAKFMAENSALKKQALQASIKTTQERFDALKKGLEDAGTPLEAVNWETGEINEPKPAG